MSIPQSGREAPEKTLNEVFVSSVDQPERCNSDQLESTTDTFPLDSEKAGQQTVTPGANNIPDGGLRAWLIVLGAFFIQFCVFGYTTAFGVYEDYYTRFHITNASSSAISWIGSINAFVLVLGGLWAGPLYDRGYFYYLLYGGSFLTSFSLFMLSLTKPNHYYQNFLAHGIGLGLGGGMLYVPSVAIISQYFSTKRTLAMTFVAAGSSLGAIVHPIMLNNLFASHLGFQGAVRASAGLVTGVLFIACLLLRPRFLPTANVAKPSMWKLARKFYKEWSYIAISLGGFFMTIGFYFPLFYLQLDSVKHGIGERFSFYVLVIMNGCSLLGRLAPGPFIHSVGVVNMITGAAACCSVLILGMIGISSLPSIVVIAVLYGFFSGIYVSLQAPLVAVFTNDMSELGARMGIAYTCIAFGSLIGPPIHGALLTGNFIWWRPALESGIFVVIGAIAYASIVFVARRSKS